jgi:molecular chaperone GrpE
MLLAQEGVTVIETEGRLFDPTLHQAVTHEESEEHEEGQIIGEVQKGYKMGDRVLRPSLVRVAKKVSGDEEQD